MVHGVLFEVDGVQKHSVDLGLEFVSYDLTFPSTKTNYIDIEGSNGQLDLTEVYGDIFYTNRTIILNFNSQKGFNQTIRDIATFLHGKYAKIILYDDADYYYLGRVSFDKYSSDNVYGKVILKCECEPFKYKTSLTKVTLDVTGELTTQLINNRMETVPKFTSSTSMQLKWQNSRLTLQPNHPTMYENILLKQGSNEITFVGTGTITIEYQEGTF